VVGVGSTPRGSLGDVLAARRRARFVGRSAEIELFTSAVERSRDRPFSVLYLHGPGGVGKTSLLDVLAEIATGTGASVARLDGAELQPSPPRVLEALREVTLAQGDSPALSTDDAGNLVLLIDAYERMSTLDNWFRTRLLTQLPASTLTVVAARDAPSAAWRADQAWTGLLRVVSLRNLDPGDSRELLRHAGVDPALHDRILSLSYGHPLGLALLADLARNGDRLDADVLAPDFVEALLRRFLDAVPDPTQRRALAAAAVAHRTTEALLRDVFDAEDVHDVFTWLWQLSFVEPRPDGLAPHDLARDVLDADLRWRDFETYRHVFDQVRRHSLAALRHTSGRAQQRAVVDLKYLFRRVRTGMSPIELDTWGEYYPERARLDDRGDVLRLVRDWEGEESATIAEAWLDRQPRGFWVVRHHDGSVRGVLAIVNLTQASVEEIDADPGTRAAWRFAQENGPPRPGEALTQCRFVVDRETYQGPSPTLNATPILTLQEQLATPNLSWDFLTLAEPDRWDEFFAAADLPRAEGADFSVGNRRYGLFAHDFRKRSVDVLTRLWTEQALAYDAGSDRQEHQPAYLLLSFPDFEAAVRQGFKDLQRPDLLARNPLVRTRLVGQGSDPGCEPGAALNAVLREGVSTLSRHPRDERLLRAVDRTYLRPAATQEAAAAALSLPFSTYRRHLTAGMRRIVSALWDMEVYGQERTDLSTR
jgi:hypothetical protein